MNFHIFVVLLSLLFSFSLSGETEQLTLLKKEVLEEHKNILKFWTDNTVDLENGGFIGQIDGDMTKQPKADKGLILNARIIWAYSAAYKYTNDTQYLELATRAFRFFMDKFYDKNYDGMPYFMIDYEGKPTMVRNQAIAVAFATYALSEYYRATKSPEALEYTLKLFNSLEKHALDTKSNGYFDAFSQEWEKLDDMRMYPGDPNATKTMNANFHIMVAYANIYREYKDNKVKKALKNLIEVLIDKIIDKERGSCNLNFKDDWEVVPSNDNYGLDIEATWLIWDAVQVLGDEDLKKKVKPIILKMVDHCVKYGYDKDGGMMNEGNDEKGVLNTDKSWWVQAESVIAFFNAYQITGETKYLSYALLTWDFIKKYVIDRKNGEWFGTVSKDDHTPNMQESKIGPWKCPYHNSRMGLQIAERVDSILNSKA